MNESMEKTFEQALEEFVPVSDAKQRTFKRHLRKARAEHGSSGFEHCDRPAALELYTEGSAHRAVHAFEKVGEGLVDTVVEVQGNHVEHISRLASREDGAILPDNVSGDEVMASLRQGDIALFEEFYEHPERFVRYNLKRGPSWEQSSE